jgi:hypothetical protein
VVSATVASSICVTASPPLAAGAIWRFVGNTPTYMPYSTSPSRGFGDELEGQLVQAVDVRLGALPGNPGVAICEATGGLVVRPFEIDLGQHLVEERHLSRAVIVEHDRAADTAVVALLDRPHLLRPDDLQQPASTSTLTW